MSTARRALNWMQGKKQRAEANGKTVLFRGQTKVWPTIPTSITRLDPATKGPMWNLCLAVMADRYRQTMGIGGCARLDPEHRMGLLQHYLLCSPVLDLTGTPLVALYFAIKNASIGSTCVVYSIEAEDADQSDCEVVNHDQLLLPLLEGGARHRWLIQDAYSIGPRTWNDQHAVERFDLLDFAGIDAFPIARSAGDEILVAQLGDLESIDDDPLATAVRSFVELTIEHYDIRGLNRVLENSRTIDKLGEQERRLCGWIADLKLKKNVGDTQLNELNRLLSEWRTCGRAEDYQAAFSYWEKRLDP